MATIILLVLFALMWVVLIVPRQRELRRHQALMAALQVGDEVMMGSGIYGNVVAIDGDYVRLEVAPGIELKVAKRSVAAKVPPAAPASEGPDGARDEAPEPELDPAPDHTDVAGK